MFGAIKHIFGHKDVSNERIYNIHVNDSEISKSLYQLLKKLQDRIFVLKEHLNTPSLQQKDDDLNDIYTELLKINTDVKNLHQDITRIIDIETKYKDYFIVKDDQFLLDKKQQLLTIQQYIGNITNVITQKPSIQELREEYIQKFFQDLTQMQQSINTIIKDDDNLITIYKGLYEI
jgi:hypothetical protein